MTAKKESTLSTKRSVSYFGATAVVIGGAFALSYFALPSFLSVSYSEPAGVASSTTSTPQEPVEEKPVATHLPTPVPLKGIYMSQCVVGTPSFRESLVKFIEESDLNAVIIDVKDFTGKISFPTDNPVLKDSVSKACGAYDMRSFIEMLHKKGIYVIGRITTFQDPYYTSLHPGEAVQRKTGSSTVSVGVWKDFKGLSFVDVGATPFWDYIVELGKESYALGFDELNFDYIRFPSDGPMSEALYTWSSGKSKPQALEEFYIYLTERLRPTGAAQVPVLSADLFGMTTTNSDDLNIGQVLERALPYFDGIYPMVYPSHYPSGFHGYAKVNEHAYDIVKYSMDIAVQRTTDTTTKIASLAYTPIMKEEIVPATLNTPTTTKSVPTGLYQKPSYPASKIRPWLQSFDYPVVYTPAMVAEQIRANTDAGLDSWLFWDAANKYNSLRKALAATSTSQ